MPAAVPGTVRVFSNPTVYRTSKACVADMTNELNRHLKESQMLMENDGFECLEFRGIEKP